MDSVDAFPATFWVTSLPSNENCAWRKYAFYQRNFVEQHFSGMGGILPLHPCYFTIENSHSLHFSVPPQISAQLWQFAACNKTSRDLNSVIQINWEPVYHSIPSMLVSLTVLCYYCTPHFLIRVLWYCRTWNMLYTKHAAHKTCTEADPGATGKVFIASILGGDMPMADVCCPVSHFDVGAKTADLHTSCRPRR